MRTIESIYWFGVGLLTGKKTSFNIGQWDPYYSTQDIPATDALSKVLEHMESENLETISGTTSILIAPGYSFHVTKGLITNFHQPDSTLLLLVAAFIGPDWKKVYNHALENEYRFLSYGDSSILFRSEFNQVTSLPAAGR
jgi:S-adenosylmethionine:tRNA ribosyltransferase-isomerase